MAQKSTNCKEVALRLQSYLDAELDEDRMEQIRDHLNECLNCGLEFEVFSDIKKDLAGKSIPADSDALARLREFSARLTEGADL